MRFLKIAMLLSLPLIAGASVANDVKYATFTIHNKTSHTVTVGVGNFFPTKYTISANATAYVSVSTDNQNIEIDSIS